MDAACNPHRRRCRPTRRPPRRAVKAPSIDKFSRLDALVSNAGHHACASRCANSPSPSGVKVFDTNLTAAFLFARAAERPLRAAGGAIVTIASTRALMSEPNTESYSASKGGLLALTHALATQSWPGRAGQLREPGLDRDFRPRRNSRSKDHQPASRPAASASRKTSPRSSPFCSTASVRASSPATNFVVDGGMTRKMMYEE